ncbi:MFS transporter [Acinetobacter sp. MD2(2019)]|uniref:MFS transporter n=1 Tax=Acinetobacter sp. MD2(2019) TaxID=2605273 RepID=UPI002D1F7A72|nr:MFS transporter [Acinetobacter sp. MD2(2019)]MEB3754767.1 MFS transporter [Acinetobacter sp. MD2(2019)]
MEEQQNLLISRRFLPIFLTQFFGALNDNVYKQALLLVITYGIIQQAASNVSTLNNLAALLFILPYFIFSATAGQIADKYERAYLIRMIKRIEIVIMLIASVGFMTHQLWLLLLALFGMGVHSTFFGPIKYAILPDILKSDELMSGNALFQTGTSLAILFGMILGGAIISISHDNLIWVCVTVISIAVLGFISSKFILKQRTNEPDLKIDWNFFRTSWQTIQYAKNIPIIFLILLGNSWYWFYGASYLTQIPELTHRYLNGSENVVSLLLTLFSLGIGLGSILCRKIGGSEVNIKMVPIGAVGLTLLAFYLAWAMSAIPAHQHTLAVLDMFQSGPIYYHIMLSIFLLGVSGGFYIVPLYALMQAYSPRSHRARVIAANNIFNAIFMVASALVSILVLSVLKIEMQWLFCMTAIFSAFFCIWLLRRLKPLLNTTPNALED